MSEGRTNLKDPPALAVREISIRFGEQQVLDSVSADLHAGRVRALVGENGSGKSTVVKILAGIYQADSGQILLDGEDLLASRYDAGSAQSAGIRFVHQDLKLVDDMDAAENVALTAGYLTGHGERIRWKATRSALADWMVERFGRAVPLNVPVSHLSAIERVHVAISRALFTQPESVPPQILVLDEVTSGLPRSEVAEVERLVAGVCSAGVAVLFISHELDEVMDIADDVTVLRGGQVVGQLESAEVKRTELAGLILGRPEERRSIRRRPTDAESEPILALRRVSSGILRDVDFELHPGEAVGVTGGLRSGKSALGRILYGLELRESGQLLIDGSPARRFAPYDAIAKGIGYVPQHHAAIPSMTVGENVGIVSLRDRTRYGWLSLRRDRAIARERLEAADVRPPDPERLIDVLSGGNRQKVVLARWMSRPLRTLIVDDVTANVDVGATEAIHSLLRERVDAGLGLVVVSSDYRELERLCDSVLILNRGRIGEVLTGESVNQHRIADRILAGFDQVEGAEK